MGAGAPLASVVLYDASTRAWTALPDMTTPREAPGACIISSKGVTKLYAFGGVVAYPPPGGGNMNITATVESIIVGPSFSNTSWQAEPALPSARTSPSVASLPDGSGCLIVGGFTQARSEEFGPPWNARAAHTHRRPSPSTVEARQLGFAYLTEVWHFDGATYSALPSMPCAPPSSPQAPLSNCGLSNMGIATGANGVYLVGGGALYPSYFNVSYLQLKPTVGSKWEAKAPLNAARSYAMMATLTDPAGEEMIVAAGGMSLQPMFDPMSSVEVYSPGRGTWTMHGEGDPGALPTPVGFGSGARLNATHMLAAGGVGAGTSGTEAFLFAL